MRGGDACVARFVTDAKELRRATQASPPIRIIRPRPYSILLVFLHKRGDIDAGVVIGFFAGAAL
jgi:hypothetical protein